MKPGLHSLARKPAIHHVVLVRLPTFGSFWNYAVLLNHSDTYVGHFVHVPIVLSRPSSYLEMRLPCGICEIFFPAD